MATDPTDAAPAADEAPAPAAGSSGGFKAWLPLLVTIIVMPALAYGMTTFVLLPRLQKGLGATPVAASTPDSKKPDGVPVKKESVTINKLLVNVAGTMGARYLLVSVSVTGTGADFKTRIQEAEPQLRDMAGGTLATKTLADLEKPGARNLIRTELITGFNTILGGQVVQELYLTEFAIQ